MNAAARPIPSMCDGCARNRRTTCQIIKEPAYIYERRGTCFAKVDAIRAKEIEDRIKFLEGLPGKRPAAISL